MRPHQPTPTPHMKGDNRRQRETRPLQSPRRRPHQPTPTPHIKGDNRRQWETTGDKTTSEPKKPTTPTNTKAARSKVALRTPTVNCLGKNLVTSAAVKTTSLLNAHFWENHWNVGCKSHLLNLCRKLHLTSDHCCGFQSQLGFLPKRDEDLRKTGSKN